MMQAQSPQPLVELAVEQQPPLESEHDCRMCKLAE